ncbi:MAG: class D beta-lactamase [Rhodospirillales bacterium]
MAFGCALLLSAALALAATAETTQPAPLDLVGVEGERATMVIRRLSDGKTWIANPARAERLFSPASTSKIPHTLIALESGFATPDEVIAWDGRQRWLEAWNQDQTLRSAFQRSAIWVYQRLTESLGQAAMADWIARFDYGNRDVGEAEDLTTYWLRGPLAISARQQIDFLERLVRQTLPLSPQVYPQARAIMQADAGGDWVLYAKTGWFSGGRQTDIGWYVGWVERGPPAAAEVYLFAFNFDMTSPAESDKRLSVPLQALSAMGALPRDAR